ncbi:CAP domain-containing protein [Rhodoferax sp.]|uniref:CAP domain-containing protein n=1 Tax=Rhodoferax sp. TaxID=50421 RepID=UPI002775CFDF|nr:CAP domain-containing protein [Rhodoferax sp.]
MKTTKLLRAAVTAVAIATLTACGGGGSDPAPVVPVTPVVTIGNLLTTPQASPYVAGSAEKRTFDEINRIRIGGGFGAAVHDATMDKAAAAHVDYWLANPIKKGHEQIPGNPGFTGVWPWDRCTAAAVGESSALASLGFLTCSENGTMSDYSRAELHVMGSYALATGHLQNALDYRYNRTGMSFKHNPSGLDQWSKPGDDPTFGVMKVGYRSNAMAKLGSDKANSIVGVYPFDGMTGVGIGKATVIHGVSSLGYGLSILVQSSLKANPTVTTFTLRKEGATADTPTRIHQAGTMDGTEPTIAGWGIMFPTVVLDVNSKYTVTFAGSVDGTPVSKTWSFTTGTTAESRLGG